MYSLHIYYTFLPSHLTVSPPSYLYILLLPIYIPHPPPLDIKTHTSSSSPQIPPFSNALSPYSPEAINRCGSVYPGNMTGTPPYPKHPPPSYSYILRLVNTYLPAPANRCGDSRCNTIQTSLQSSSSFSTFPSPHHPNIVLL